MSKKFFKDTKSFDVAYVPSGCEYWFDKLLSFCLSMFKWENLPKTLPQYEIESNLILTGHCTIFKSDGELITNKSVLFGNDLYLQPTNATVALINRKSPTVKLRQIFSNYGQKGVDGITFYNSILKEYTLGVKTDSSLLFFITRYARMLADIDSTISIYTVNIRDTYIPSATNSKTRESLNKFFAKRERGERYIVSDSTIVPLLKPIDISSDKSVKDGLNDLLLAKDKILEQFYRDIGVKFYNPKKAQVGNEEVEANNGLLLINTDDLLRARQEGAGQINKMFNTNINVDFSSTFKKIKSEV